MSSHHLNQCWRMVNWVIGNKLEMKLNQSTKYFLTKMYLKMWSTKRWPSCTGLLLMQCPMTSKRVELHQSSSYLLRDLFFFWYTIKNGNCLRCTRVTLTSATVQIGRSITRSDSEGTVALQLNIGKLGRPLTGVRTHGLVDLSTLSTAPLLQWPYITQATHLAYRHN